MTRPDDSAIGRGVTKRHNKTCYELINNQTPNLDYLVPFHSPCSLLQQYKDSKSKFHAKAVEGIYLGYVANSLCKIVYSIGNRTVEEWFEVDCSKHNITPEPTGPAWGFDYDALFNFSTRATVPIVTLDSNTASASGTHVSDNTEDVHVDGNDVEALSCDNTLDREKAPAYFASTQEYLCVLVKYARAFCPAHLLSAHASGQV
ncbi:hypothetical protein L1987_40437 [Smallanthus sonchifolius]|uniref:Uncharacterized protein n=1 Tax=Smallanthus sonchifolius TaxID=185202 RepID=A0ACB9GUI6_9ASTR|nr:hypothetical protein L1987_40437 [Smallanthus sonchifolius]